MTMTFSTSTLKPRTSNGTHAGTEEDRTALVLDALAATEPAPALVAAPAEPVSPRRRKARVVEAQPAPEVSEPAPARLDEPSDLEVLGEVALQAHAQGLTLQLYVERLTRQLDAVRRLLGVRP